jgi:DNA-binding SARP family transcriptional activator
MRAVLALLLVKPGQVVPVETFIDELWPHRPPDDARSLVHNYMSRVRRALRRASADVAARLVTRKPGYLLRVADGELDSLQFTRLVAQAKEAWHAAEPQRAIWLYQQALDLWRGEPFGDVPATPGIVAAASRLTELRLNVLEDQFDLALAAGGDTGLVAELTALAAAHPLRERILAQLMLALYRTGRTADALAVFDQARARLASELGIDPGAALQQRHEQILRCAPELDPVDGLAEDSRGPGWTSPQQLPADVADFVGRDDLVAELTELLAERAPDRPPPVVAISGGPGVGKSSLAVHVAHRLREEFPDGRLYVDLAGMSDTPRDPAMLLAELLVMLGVNEVPDGLAARAARYRSRLAGRRVLLVLDDAADADRVQPLLPADGGCAVVVTSRHTLPDLLDARHVGVDVLRSEEAHRLLATLAGPARVAAEPEQANAIVRSCGQLPLALRIVGGRLAGRPGWPLRVLHERLADESRRIAELRAGGLAVRASFDLSLRALPSRAARAFSLLGLLDAQAFSAWAVESLLDQPDADEVVDTLVDANLVRLTGLDSLGQPHYRMHDLLRVYAVETAGTMPEDERRAAVARYLAVWLTLAESAVERLGPSLFRAPAGRTRRRTPFAAGPVDNPLAWLDAERATALRAIELAVRWELDELAWELAATVAPYFDHRSLYKEWQHGHRLALRAVREHANERGEAELLRGLAQVEIYRDELSNATTALRRARSLFAGLDDRRGEGLAVAGLATINRLRGDYSLALTNTETALDHVRTVGDRHTEAQLLASVGAILLALGRTAESMTWFERAHTLATSLGDVHREAVVLRRMSRAHVALGEPQPALRCLYTALRTFEDLDDERCVAYTLLGIGQIQAVRGTLASTGPILERAAMIFNRNGDRTEEAACWQALGDLAAARNDDTQAHHHYDHATALLLPSGLEQPADGRRYVEAAPGG